ncbi:MAG: hypothetical protein DHS20C19_24420 [Acidimicrobiales bacterium]|nr:MAG: hypothetical protein DHS20C19_24420 [Acidimicrobiales bacterium]
MERRDALITSILVLVLCVAITAVVIARRDPFSEPFESIPTTTTTEAELAGGNERDELDAFVDEAIAFIEELREAPFVSRPDVVVLTDRAFVERIDADLTADFAADPEMLSIVNAQYRAAALIDPNESIDEVVRSFGEAGILGFYDPSTAELVVREANGLSLLTKSTIVHELVHAYDDQLFDLDRPEYDERTDEIPWTFRAVAEGSATWAENEWQATLSATELDQLFDEELAFGNIDILSQFELSFLLLELSPYEAGEPFVDGLVEAGGVDALAEVLVDPPDTSEQVLDRARYAADEQALDVAAPPADGAVLWSGAGGQALIEALFVGNFVGTDVSWGGDQMTIWLDDVGRSCLRWDLRADTEDGLEELQVGFERWGNAVGQTRVTTVDGITIRVDRCS